MSIFYKFLSPFHRDNVLQDMSSYFIETLGNLEKPTKEHSMNFLIVLSIFWVSVLVKFSRYP